MKDPKKVEVGNRLAEYSNGKREEMTQIKAQKSERENNLTYYGAGATEAIGFLGVIGYYAYQSKTPKENLVNQPKEAPACQPKETPANKFAMD